MNTERANGKLVASIAHGSKPKLRGVIHKYSFFVSLLTGPLMMWMTVSEAQVFSNLIYSLSVTLLFGTSALYHCVNWPENQRLWMRRLDHTMILVLIAGTYTPLVSTGIDDELGRFVLKVVWGATALGALIKLGYPNAPKWVSGLSYGALGWFALYPLEAIINHWGWSCAQWLLAGGVLYTIGAIAYALKRPNPWPESYGYHEIFHSFVSLAALCHYRAITEISWATL